MPMVGHRGHRGGYTTSLTPDTNHYTEQRHACRDKPTRLPDTHTMLFCIQNRKDRRENPKELFSQHNRSLHLLLVMMCFKESRCDEPTYRRRNLGLKKDLPTVTGGTSGKEPT